MITGEVDFQSQKFGLWEILTVYKIRWYLASEICILQRERWIIVSDVWKFNFLKKRSYETERWWLAQSRCRSVGKLYISYLWLIRHSQWSKFEVLTKKKTYNNNYKFDDCIQSPIGEVWQHRNYTNNYCYKGISGHFNAVCVFFWFTFRPELNRYI